MHLLNATYQEIQNKIKENSETREKEKNTFAEVFTPLELIEDMLNHFPPSVWKNPNNKWLDPSAGRGNFFLVVYFRLMQSLKNTIQDKNKRHKHILSKMLYMVELNTDNYHTLLFLFGKNTNIINDDFLNDTHSLNKEKFHIIVSNPPYQKNKQHTYAGSSGNKTLWDKFLLKSLNTLLSPNGFLGMITPSNWRRPEHPLLDIMSKQNQLLYLHIFNKKQGLEIFKAQTRFDVYCIQKTPIYKKTTIIDETNKTHIVCLKKTPFIPNGDFHAIHKITTIETKNGTPILYNSSLYSSKKLKKQKTKKYKHPIIHTMTKKGLGVRYSKVPFFKEPKVILNFNETLYPYNDFLGKYGLSQLSFGIPIKSKKEGEQYVKALNTDTFKTIVKNTKWGSFQTDHRMFKYFKKGFPHILLTRTRTRTRPPNHHHHRNITQKNNKNNNLGIVLEK